MLSVFTRTALLASPLAPARRRRRRTNATLAQVIELQPADSFVHMSLGVLLAQTGGSAGGAGRWPEAADAFRRAVQLQPANGMAREYLGMAEARMHERVY